MFLLVVSRGNISNAFDVAVSLPSKAFTLTDNVVTVDMSKDFTHAQAKVTSLNYDGDDFINLINKED